MNRLDSMPDLKQAVFFKNQNTRPTIRDATV